MPSILVLNGPNLNLLGTREPEIYGRERLEDIMKSLVEWASERGCDVTWAQHDAEHELMAAVHAAAEGSIDWIVINPAGFTHSSVALRDALLAAGTPFSEVHLSNIHGREEFRRRSYFSDIARGTITGFGAIGYRLAVEGALSQLQADAGRQPQAQ